MRFGARLHVDALNLGEYLGEVQAVFGKDEYGTIHGGKPDFGDALRGYVYANGVARANFVRA